MGMNVIREDSQVYMFPGEMMALFNDGAVDVGQLFSSAEFMQQPSSQHQADRQRSVDDGGPMTGFTSPASFLKNVIVNS
jgi:hypothetical protein